MSSHGIPDEVRALLRQHLTSFEKLEILLLLQAHPEQALSVRDIAASKNISEDLVIIALNELHTSRLIGIEAATPRAVYRYAPVTTELAHATKALARVADEQRAAVMSLMSANAIERVRSGAVRAFADAFIVRKKKDDDG